MNSLSSIHSHIFCAPDLPKTKEKLESTSFCEKIFSVFKKCIATILYVLTCTLLDFRKKNEAELSKKILSELVRTIEASNSKQLENVGFKSPVLFDQIRPILEIIASDCASFQMIAEKSTIFSESWRFCVEGGKIHFELILPKYIDKKRLPDFSERKEPFTKKTRWILQEIDLKGRENKKPYHVFRFTYDLEMLVMLQICISTNSLKAFDPTSGESLTTFDMRKELIEQRKMLPLQEASKSCNDSLITQLDKTLSKIDQIELNRYEKAAAALSPGNANHLTIFPRKARYLFSKLTDLINETKSFTIKQKATAIREQIYQLEPSLNKEQKSHAKPSSNTERTVFGFKDGEVVRIP